MRLRRLVAIIVMLVPVASCSVMAQPPASTAATASPVASGSPNTPQVGAITGGLGYPSDFIPPLTVYAVSVADQRIFFSVDTPRYGGSPNPSPPSATIVPGVRPSYTITGVAPGIYYVFAYRNDNDPNDLGGPALYSQFVLKCIQPSLAGTPIPPGACDSNSADHSLVPVTVRPGETVSRIDVMDWTSFQQVQQGNLPPRPR